MPSRFLLDTVEALTGTRLYADDLLRLDADWYRQVPSFAAGIARVPFPATEQEHRLRALLDHSRRSGGDIATSTLRAADAALARGLDCTLARASTAFTRFDGNLGGLPVPSPAGDDAVVSPTRLERWAVSPFDYLMQQMLRVEIPELPEEVYELSPLDRGIARARRRSTSSCARCSRVPVARRRPAPPWTDADRARLHEIAERAVRPLRGARSHRPARVLGPRPAPDPRRPRPLPRRRRRSCAPTTGSPPLATELRFGLPDAEWPAIELALSDGRPLRFRGAADRVDRAADGALLVIDYKTGKPRSASATTAIPRRRAPSSSSPCTRSRPGARSATTTRRSSPAYWFVSARGDFRWAEVALDDATQSPLRRSAARDRRRHRARGVPVPPRPARLVAASWRTYADPDARGTRDRYREWVRKRGAPELAAYVALAEPDDDEIEADESRPASTDRGRSMTVVQPELRFDARRRRRDALAIVDDLDDTMFVEAGAGSGKTKSLVDRVVALVIARRRADARDRRGHVHREGGGRAARPHPPRARAGRDQLAVRARRRRQRLARAALDELDAAAVSTLHAFAQRLLSENPIEAGLPPRIEVLDDIGSQVAFEDRWTRFVDLLLDDPALERALLLALNADTSLADAAHHRARVQRQLGPRAGAHGTRARPAAARR